MRQLALALALFTFFSSRAVAQNSDDAAFPKLEGFAGYSGVLTGFVLIKTGPGSSGQTDLDSVAGFEGAIIGNVNKVLGIKGDASIHFGRYKEPDFTVPCGLPACPTQYAVDAFELSAADYLLKPVSRVRLAQALGRVQKQDNFQPDASVDRVMRRPRMTPTRFLGRRGSRFVVIPQGDVVYVGSEGGLTKLHTTNQHYVMEPSLNDFDCRLDPAVFFRVSRTAIVNLGYVAEVDAQAGGYGEVVLKNGVRLEVSRRLRLLLAKLEGE